MVSKVRVAPGILKDDSKVRLEFQCDECMKPAVAWFDVADCLEEECTLPFTCSCGAERRVVMRIRSSRENV